MRRLVLLLLLGVALTASATDIWRSKDANGVVHYSDSPFPGAERMNVNPVPPSGDTPAVVSAPAAPTQDSTPFRYTRCVVTQPSNDETFFAVDTVSASVTIEPSLQTGHHIQVYLNGAAYPAWPATALSYTFTGLNRGSYTLAVRVVDQNDRALCTGASINFYVRQPSVLSPQSPLRQQPAKK